MNSKTLHNRRWNWLLLGLFVYQLGVGACGCLDHNAWYQFGKSCVVAVCSPDAALSSHSDDCEENEDCDEHAKVVYTSSRCSVVHSLEFSLVAELALGQLQAKDLRPEVQPTYALGQDANLVLSAPDVRAHLQVFLI